MQGWVTEELNTAEFGDARVDARFQMVMDDLSQKPSVIAWRVMYVMMLGRQCPEISCAEIFGEAEWKAVYTVVQGQAAPDQPPTLAAVVSRIASLGGHLGRKHDGPPGPKAMWIGMQRMRDLALAWDAVQLAARAARSRKKCG